MSLPHRRTSRKTMPLGRQGKWHGLRAVPGDIQRMCPAVGMLLRCLEEVFSQGDPSTTANFRGIYIIRQNQEALNRADRGIPTSEE